ncbi:MAG TPA: rhodanese-like domain-containing protein [Gammaproteobacteria bacterium]
MKTNIKQLLVITISLSSCIVLSARAQEALDVKISENLANVEAVHEGEVVSIQRIQDENHVLTGGYTKTSRKCPPFCIQPMQVAPGVTTVGELELLDFIENKVNKGTGILIDARTPAWFEKGTIPGSINIPFTTFDDNEGDLVKTVALGQLGVPRNGAPSYLAKTWNFVVKNVSANNRHYGKWDFSNAKDILLWCNGVWCGQSPKAIKGLIKIGYPPEKIFYYRGGMQSWQLLGLTVTTPKTQKTGD